MIMIRNLLLCILAVATWNSMFPEEAASLIADFKSQLRLRIIRRAGAEGAKELAQDLHRWAAQRGIDTNMVEQTLAERRGYIEQRLGRIAANRLVSESDPTESDD